MCKNTCVIRNYETISVCVISCLCSSLSLPFPLSSLFSSPLLCLFHTHFTYLVPDFVCILPHYIVFSLTLHTSLFHFRLSSHEKFYISTPGKLSASRAVSVLYVFMI